MIDDIRFWSCGDVFTINMGLLQVYKNGKYIDLSFVEFRLFYAMAFFLGREVPRRRLCLAAFKGGVNKRASLAIAICRLRVKLGGHRYIVNIHRGGYKINVSEQ